MAEAARYLEDSAAVVGWLHSESEQEQGAARLHDYIQHAYNRLLHSRRLACAARPESVWSPQHIKQLYGAVITPAVSAKCSTSRSEKRVLMALCTASRGMDLQ